MLARVSAFAQSVAPSWTAHPGPSRPADLALEQRKCNRRSSGAAGEGLGPAPSVEGRERVSRLDLKGLRRRRRKDEEVRTKGVFIVTHFRRLFAKVERLSNDHVRKIRFDEK